jgi:hypothetical protein
MHVLRLRFKDDAREQDKLGAIEAIGRIGNMESVEFAVIGQDLDNCGEGYTYSHAFAIKDLDAFERYMNDPVHRAADFDLHPYVQKLGVFDISDDMDPELAVKITDVSRRRFAGDPELVELLEAIPEIVVVGLDSDS